MADDRFQLIIREGPKSGQIYTLDLERIIIGRDPLADIVIDDPGMSRHHACLIRRQGGFDLQDTDSTNGTFLEEERLGSARVALEPGQHIRLGDNVILLFSEASAADPQAVAVSQASSQRNTAAGLGQTSSLTDTATLLPVDRNRNPYVGPRAFEPDEREFFYGRDDEIAILRAQVMARRASLFFAQSGAGKSSLLRAGLLPELTQKKTIGRGARKRTYQKMRVLPILSVGAGIPANLRSPITNIYILSALLMLNPDGDPDELAEMTLSQGLAPHFVDGDEEPTAELASSRHATLLIFDQFEEIFTHYPERWREREAFFNQVCSSLEKYPNLHVLFTMREDYIAEMTPYANLLPGGLRARFRLERLNREAALSAVTAPAKKAGRVFTEGVAEALVDNLRRSQPGHRRHSTGAAEEVELGAYVEPVHLQIVCRQLWEKLPLRRRTIEATDVQEFGDVDQALIGFYESSLTTAGAQASISERRLRAWFDNQLITQARTRDLVYRGESESEGLPNDAVDVLNDAYIIRASVRGGDVWYELAHDRLVEPILFANQRWYEEYQNPLDKATKAWLVSGRDPQRLLDGGQLQEAQAFADEHPEDVLEEERAFLVESRRQEGIRDEQARSRRRTRRIMFLGALIFIVGLLITSVAALNAARQAQEAEEIAEQEAANAQAAEANAQAAAQDALAAQAQAEAEAANARAAEQLAEQEAANARAAEEVADEQRGRAEASAQDALAAQDEAEAQFEEAQRQTRRSLAEGLAASALIEASKPLPDPSLALILARESVLVTRDVDGFVVDTARRALLESVAIAPPWVRNLSPAAGPAAIQDIAFSPNGQRLAAATLEGSAYVWALDASEEIPLQGHGDRLTAIAFSPDGGQVATASLDGTAVVWDARDGREVFNLEGHDGPVNTVAFSPDGIVVVTGGEDGQLLIWDADNGSQRFSLDDIHGGLPIKDVAFSPTGARFASAGADDRIVLWSVSNGAFQFQRSFIHRSPLSVAFNPSGSRLVTTGTDNRARIWNTFSGQQVALLEGHPNWVEAAAFSPNGELIVTGSDDTTVRLWDAGTGEQLMLLPGHTGFVTSVAVAPNGRFVASGAHDGAVKLWAPDAPDRVPQLDHGGVPVASGEFAPDNRTVVTVDNSLRIHRWRRGGSSLGLYQPPVDAASALGLAAGGVGGSDASFTLIAEGPDRSIQLWNMDNDQVLLTVERHEVGSRFAVMSADGSHMAVVGCDELAGGDTITCARESVIIWDTASGQMVNKLEDTGTVWSVSLSRDGSRLSTVGENGVSVWDTGSGASLGTFPGDGAQLSPDGRRVAIVFGTVGQIFDVDSGEQLVQLFGHRDAILDISFSPDGQSLITASWDSTARVWEAETGFELLSLTGHTDQVTSARFSSDGNLILTTSEDGTARLWPYSVEELLKLAEPLIQRQPPRLTPEEARRFGLPEVN